MEALCPGSEAFNQQRAKDLARVTQRNADWKKKGKGMSKSLSKKDKATRNRRRLTSKKWMSNVQKKAVAAEE